MRRLIWIFGLLLFVPIVSAIDESEGLPDLSEIPPHAQAVVLGETLLGDEWRLYHIYEDEFQVIFGWTYEGAVITLTRIDFSDTVMTIGEYISQMEEQFVVILENYQPNKLIAHCENRNGVILDEFVASPNGVDYHLRHYMWETSPDTLWTLGIYFPVERLDDLDDILTAFQPELISCADEEND